MSDSAHSDSGGFGPMDIPWLIGFVVVWTLLIIGNLLIRPRYTVRELRRQFNHAR